MAKKDKPPSLRERKIKQTRKKIADRTNLSGHIRRVKQLVKDAARKRASRAAKKKAK